jgi:hypothetical protein
LRKSKFRRHKFTIFQSLKKIGVINLNKTISKILTIMIAGIIVSSLAFPAVAASSKTYTTNADFDQGVLDGVNHDVADQLQLNSKSTTFPVMWIANAGEDTISKIDTRTGNEDARYRTWFGPAWHGAWEGPAPSRTAVDKYGNVYVANRHFDGKKAEIVKILADGGIDRNGNGIIDTSTGSTPLPLTDTNANGIVDPAEIQDERVAWIVQVGNPNGLGRSLSIDTDGNLWLGLYNDRVYYKVSSDNGAILDGPISVGSNTPYGSMVDKNGILWGASLDSTLLKLNTTTLAQTVYTHGNSDYGLALGNNKVYMGCTSGCSFIQFDPATNTFSTPAAILLNTLGIAVDADGNILVGKSSGGIIKFKPDGTVIWNVGPQSGTSEARGVVVDSDNNVWAVNVYEDKISKFNGSDGSSLGTFPVGHSPYTYSDASGLGLRISNTQTGTWNVIYDSTSAGTSWDKVSWADSIPTDANIEVKVRTADTEAGLQLVTYDPVSKDVPFIKTGRFIQVDVRLTANTQKQSPILFDLTVVPKDGGNGESIPEFQGIALPILSLIGLMAIIYYRRREE